LLIALALAVVALGLWPLMAQVHLAEYDEAVFLDVARNIQTAGVPIRSYGEAGLYYFIHTPLYPYLLSSVAGSLDDRVLIARWTTVLFALGCVCLAILIGEQLYDITAGFIAGLLTAANSFFLLHAFFVTMEVAMVFFMLLSLYCLVRSEQTGSWRWCFAAGLALAGAVLLKEMALGLLAVYFVYELLISRRHGRIRRLVFIAGPTLISFAAWVIWAWAWSPVQVSAALNRWFTSAVAGGAGFRMNTTVSQWSEKLGGDLLSWGVGALFLVSLYFYAIAVRNKTHVALVPLLYVIVAVGVSYLIRLKELRHVIAVVPMTALVIGIGLSQLLIDWRARQARGAPLLVGILLVVAVVDASPIHLIPPPKIDASWLDPLYAYRLQENDRYYGVLHSAGLYLAEHTPAEEVITVVHEATAVSYYADRPYKMLYVLSYDAVMEELAQSQYLVYDNRMFPQLSEGQIQDVEAYLHSHFEVEAAITENGRTVMIYRNASSR